MSMIAVRLYYDLIDPLSYLLDVECTAVERARAIRVERVPFELRPPPAGLIDSESPEWRERWDLAEDIAGGLDIVLRRPSFVPWSRKAHEMVMHAKEVGHEDEVRTRLFQATLIEGLDLGRIDVLVGLAREMGLDASRTKAVLDVDRHAEAVAAARLGATAHSVVEAPAFVRGSSVLRGFHNRDALDTFLRDTAG